jgi:hypothetical protein
VDQWRESGEAKPILDEPQEGDDFQSLAVTVSDADGLKWRSASWRQQASVIGAIGKAAAFAVLRIAHLRQVAALQVVATTLEMALGRARLQYDRQQHQSCRQRDHKHSHDLAPSSHNSQVQPFDFGGITRRLFQFPANQCTHPERYSAPTLTDFDTQLALVLLRVTTPNKSGPITTGEDRGWA